ncbi:hypothetical protein H2200_013344 [Cladophialophora chaetospira]|uniref:Uncharacterized protein n=1 Tax=Cladophialophora chaetospira TaxID=386627 RepID=A0AA39CBB6_9EURO|nr:hypothetical protein H2200_013344 [Cladophialophora chaetospira]
MLEHCANPAGKHHQQLEMISLQRPISFPRPTSIRSAPPGPTLPPPTSISSTRQASLAAQPGTALPTPQFRVGAEVFLIDGITGNNILASSTIGTGFDGMNSGPTAFAAQPLSWAKPFFQGVGDSLTLYQYDSSGVFIVRERLIKMPCGQNLKSDGGNLFANTADLARGQYLYHIVPKNGVGEARLVSGTRLVEVRFCPGEWVWYSPSKVPVGGRSKDAKGVARQSKEKAMVIGVEVLRRRRVYDVHLAGRGEDRMMVTDERLEKVMSAPA